MIMIDKGFYNNDNNNAQIYFLKIYLTINALQNIAEIVQNYNDNVLFYYLKQSC